jgi:molecular chaperone GrpE
MFAREWNIPDEPTDPLENPGDQGGAQSAGPAEDAEVRRLRQQLEELNTKYIRTVADYQNSARRSVKDADDARYQGMKSVILNVLTVLDHFDLALSQDVQRVSAEQMIGGVRVIRDELMKVLHNHGVELIAPQPNDGYDPNLHQVVTHLREKSISPGHIVRTLQPGYKLDGRVIRPAMVAVQPGAGEEAGAE